MNGDGKLASQVLDTFVPSSEFSQVVDLYVFDKRLRLMMLDVLKRIEVSIRTDVALQMGIKNNWAYRDKALLDGKFTAIDPQKGGSRFDEFVRRFDEMAASSKEEFVAHFRSTYSDPLPIWAAVELWDFGMLSMFIAGMKYGDMRDIANKYGVSRPELFPTWVRTLAFVRNICAHHSRLWNKPLIAQPKLPRLNDVPLLNHLAGDTFASEHFYSAAAIARYFQLQINPTSSWGARFVSLIETFPEGPKISIGQAGFPAKWCALPLWIDKK